MMRKVSLSSVPDIKGKLQFNQAEGIQFFVRSHVNDSMNVEGNNDTQWDIGVCCYDLRGILSEKIILGSEDDMTVKADGSCRLFKDDDFRDPHLLTNKSVTIKFNRIRRNTTAFAIYLNPLNITKAFSMDREISLCCYEIDGGDEETLEQELKRRYEKNSDSMNLIFEFKKKVKAGTRSLLMCIVHLDDDSTLVSDKKNKQSMTPVSPHKRHERKWVAKQCMTSLYSIAETEREEYFTNLVVNTVAVLDRFRTRTFSSIKELASALISRSLPKLKVHFEQTRRGLPIDIFTKAVFLQLLESYPNIEEESEAAYTIALIREIFFQIDINGDKQSDWDEFTSFCIHQSNASDQQTNSEVTNDNSNVLNEYVIEYKEDVLRRDTILSSHRIVTLMKFIPELRKFIILTENSNHFLLVDEDFKINTEIYPDVIFAQSDLTQRNKVHGNDMNESEKILELAKHHSKQRVIAFDIIYMGTLEMFAFCSTDRSINICKKHSVGTKMVCKLQLANRLFHGFQHYKLCWSARNELLCSVAADHSIYGWALDISHPLFHFICHADAVGEFICIDKADIFITGSMDKSIIVWSAKRDPSPHRRKHFLLAGHKRGVRCLSYDDSTLLSSGFETEARTWDLETREPIGILKGHRNPITVCRFMCQTVEHEWEKRAITVDEKGEFRVWNVFISQRTTELYFYPTMQIFEMTNPEPPMNNVRFLELPYNPTNSASYYSDLVACGTKLLHFTPIKNSSDFLPPTSCCFNQANSSIITAVGKGLVKYSAATGLFLQYFDSVGHEITTMHLDGVRGRRLFVGCIDGSVLLLNYFTGTVISRLNAHSKEVTTLAVMRTQTHNMAFSGSTDGTLRYIVEVGGNLHSHMLVEAPFLNSAPISRIQSCKSLKCIVVGSTERQWGVWMRNGRNVLRVTERDVIHALEIVWTKGDSEEDEDDDDDDEKEEKNETEIHPSAVTSAESKAFDNLLTVAIAFSSCIHIYTVDINDDKGVLLRVLKCNHSVPVNITTITLLRAPEYTSVNFTRRSSNSNSSASVDFEGRVGKQLVAVSEDGMLFIWDANAFDTEGRLLFEQRHLSKHHAIDGKSEVNSVVERVSQSLGERRRSRKKLDTIVASSEAAIKFAKPLRSQKTDKVAPASSAASSSSSSRKLPISRQEILELARDKSFRAGRSPLKPSRGLVRVNSSNNRNAPLTFQIKDEDHITKGMYTDTDAGAFLRQFGAAAPPLEARSWRAHMDLIPTIVPMHKHGCILTVSLDGYHRIWNTEADLLGEFTLPNLTDAMKASRVTTYNGWSFALGRISVNSKHREIAAQIVHDYKMHILRIEIPASLKPRENSEVQRRTNFLETAKRSSSACRKSSQQYNDNTLPSSALKTRPRTASMAFSTRDGSQLRKDIGARTSLGFFVMGMDSREIEDLELRYNALKDMKATGVDLADGPPDELPNLLDDAHLSKLVSSQKLRPTSSKLSLTATLNNGSMRLSSPKASSSPRLPNLNTNSATKLNSGSFFNSKSMPNMTLENESNLDEHGRAMSAARLKFESIFQEDEKLRLEDSMLSDFNNHLSRPSTASAKRPPSRYEKGALQVENSLWSTASMVCEHKNRCSHATAPAFSDSSLMSAFRSNAIDGVEYQTLQRVGKNNDLVNAYERSQPVLLLRNPSLSTSVVIPQQQELDLAEVTFGDQVGMYKNTEGYLATKIKPPKYQLLHTVSTSRIQRRVRKVNKMLHVVNPREIGDSELILTDDVDTAEEQEALTSRKTPRKSVAANRRTTFSHLVPTVKTKEPSREPSPPPQPNREALEQVVERFNKLTSEPKPAHKIWRRQQYDVDPHEATEYTSINALVMVEMEKKLCKAISDAYKLRRRYNERTNGSKRLSPRKLMTNRALLPSYTIDDVDRFLESFMAVDEDLSGDLDVEEWVKLFQSFDSKSDPHEARYGIIHCRQIPWLYFHDKVRSLIPTVFNKAKPNQLKLIQRYIDTEMERKQDGLYRIAPHDVCQLFEAYDVNNHGFVYQHQFLKRVREFKISNAAKQDFIEVIRKGRDNDEDDDIINLFEFSRILRPYTMKA